MKLLTKSSIVSFILLFVVMSIGAIFIYLGISREVKGEIDEELLNRKLEIVKSIRENTTGIDLYPKIYTDFVIEEINKNEFDLSEEYYEDVDIYELIEKEKEPHRQLVSKFQYNKRFFRLKVQASLLDLEDMAEIIVISIGWIYLVIITVGFLIIRYFHKRLWTPFYSTLAILKTFRVDKDDSLVFNPTNTKEFTELNTVVTNLAEVNRKTFQQQKQFVENASHEIQTPLTIALGQAEQLIQNPNLGKDDAEALLVLNQQLERLSALNKALLLITKINNKQYAEVHDIDLIRTISNTLEDFSFLAEENDIKVDFKFVATPNLKANRFLIEILVRNLIKNALIHNIRGGDVKIAVYENEFEISNTSDFEGDLNALFQRFVKFTNNSNSLGLGLSIVKSICDYYNFKPFIQYRDGQFVFELKF